MHQNINKLTTTTSCLRLISKEEAKMAPSFRQQLQVVSSVLRGEDCHIIYYDFIYQDNVKKQQFK